MSRAPSDRHSRPDLDEVLADYMRQVDRGESVDHEGLIAAHPELANELRDFFSQAGLFSPVGAAPTSDFAGRSTQGHALKIRCPSCHSPSELAVDTPLTDLTCSSCGSHFSLVDPGQGTHMAPSISKMGRFELIGRLGVGGFGSVWKARDKELDRSVAVKIPRQGAMTAEEQEKFFREARAAAQLRHPNIVSVHEVGRDGDSIFIVSDFVRGVTLGDWLTGQQPTSREAAELCAKIADALHHAHQQGVVHRDLKPANIMIDAGGEPHLMDFGLARREVGEVTMTLDGQVLGTPAYMSPEQALGAAHSADCRSDVYSLGVILFQLLTGELPFRGNARMLVHQVISDEPPCPRTLNANVARDLETITLKCLEKDPARRYQSSEELAKELRRFLRGEPVQARPVSKFEHTWRWCRRRPAVAGLITAGVLAFLAFAGWGLREIRLAREFRWQLSDNLVNSAELHGRRGEWKEALSQLDQARAIGARDSVSLQIQRVKALNAIASPEAESETERLANRDDLGSYEAEVRLLQGLDLLANEGMDVAAPLFEQAKGAGTLSDSDDALVDGLMADTSEKAIAHFRRAVELAPFGQDARQFLVLMLSSSGRFEEAMKHAEVGRELFPEDPNFPLLLAYVEAGAGRTEKIAQRLEARSLRQMDPGVVKKYGEALKNMAVLHEESASLWDSVLMDGMQRYEWSGPQTQSSVFDEAFSGFLEERPQQLISGTTNEDLIRQFELVRALSSSQGRSTESMSVFEVAQRVMKCAPKCLVVAYKPVRDLFSLRTQGFLREGKGSVERIDRLIDELAVSVHAHPDSFFSYFRGLLLFVRGRLPEATDSFATASQQFSSFGGFAAPASFAAACCEFVRHRQGEEGALDRAIQHLRTRLDLGPLRPEHAAALFEIAMEGEDFESARRLLAAGDPKDEWGEKRIIALARVEFAAENYLEALRLLDLVPASATEQKEAREIQRMCLERLSQSVQDHESEPPPKD